MNVFPIILCGGAGTRLWPASRASRPKQFLPLLGPRSSFHDTVSRLKGMAGARPPVIVTGEGHVQAVRRELWGLAPGATVLVEPEQRNTAAAIAAALRWIAGIDPEGVAVVLACDHHVSDEEAFRAALRSAVDWAGRGDIVTLGITPTHPTSAYGYIEPGELLAAGPLRRVTRFVEKPDLEAARSLIARGALWNSGNFVAAARVLIEEMAAAAPQVLDAASRSVAEARAGSDAVRLSPAFLDAPSISIDHAVMERTRRAAVLPVSCGWSDLGAWDAVLAVADKSAAGNSVTGEAVLLDTEGCLIRAPAGQIVTAVGVKNLAIVVEPDAVLVCDLSASQSVKTLIADVRAAGHPQADLTPGGADETLESLADGFRRWLDVSALPVWWTLGADHHGGGFFDALDNDGRPLDRPRRSRVQTRQTFVYAQAGALGWPGPWREAMAHGADFVDRHFPRPDGLHRTLVDGLGRPLDDTAWLYDQAFALLALAAQGAAREDDADRLMTAIEAAFRHPGGGFAEAVAPRFVSNPVMHLFESVLAWLEIGRRGRWRALAEELGEFATGRLFDAAGGFIAEFFDADWRAPADAAQREMSPGHQFEWAWLLAKWSGLGGGAQPLAIARRLYAAGARGIHPVNRVTINALDLEFKVTDPTARLWPQTEWLKAARLLADLAEGAEAEALRRDVREAAIALRRYLEVPAPGLWRDVVADDGVLLPGPAPASSFYHVIGAVRDLTGPPRDR